MAKFKHNKKRNTALIYELLIQELTKAVMDNNKKLQEDTSSLIKKFFSKETTLYKELKLYKAISETKQVGVLTAEKIINEVKSRHDKLDKSVLIKEQNKLTKMIKKNFSDKIYSNFVPNYKELASISQIFNQNVGVKSKILLENELVGSMILKEEKKDMIPVDNIVFNSFVKRFNKEYSSKLMKEQKELLNCYITSFDNNGLGLKVFMNEEVGRLKSLIESSRSQSEIIEDEGISKNINKISEKLESYKEREPDILMVKEVLKIQELAKELQQDVD
jgi:hypothetical protein